MNSKQWPEKPIVEECPKFKKAKRFNKKKESLKKKTIKLITL